MLKSVVHAVVPPVALLEARIATGRDESDIFHWERKGKEPDWRDKGAIGVNKVG